MAIKQNIGESTRFSLEKNFHFITVIYETNLNWRIIQNLSRTPLALGKFQKEGKKKFSDKRNGNSISRCWKSNQRNLSLLNCSTHLVRRY